MTVCLLAQNEMKSFLFVQIGLTFFCFVRCDYTVKRYDDMYNGERGIEVQPGRAPYQAAVLISGEFSGSAVIISKDFALATCVYLFDIYPDSVELRVGSVDRHDGGQLVPVHDFYIHPDYNYEADNDIALIRLERNLEFSDLIQPIPLATRRPVAGERAIVSGWGYGLTQGSTILHETEMEIMDDLSCNATSEGAVTERMICANNRTNFLCDNDFGDALVVNNTLQGLYIGGLLHCHSNNVLFTSIPKHLEFIYNTMLTQTSDGGGNITLYLHVGRLNATA